MNSINYYGNNPREAARLVLSDNTTNSFYDLDAFHFELMIDMETTKGGNGLVIGRYPVYDSWFKEYPDESDEKQDNSGFVEKQGAIRLIKTDSINKKNRDWYKDYDLLAIEKGLIIVLENPNGGGFKLNFNFELEDGSKFTGTTNL
jgi:hypothetical protein